MTRPARPRRCPTLVAVPRTAKTARLRPLGLLTALDSFVARDCIQQSVGIRQSAAFGRAVADGTHELSPVSTQTATGSTDRDGEWQLIQAARRNVLIIGASPAILRLLSARLAELSGPLAEWTAGMPLPSPGIPSTVVIWDAASMLGAEQRAWFDWLNQDVSRRCQIIATTSRSIFPLVAAGQFLDLLYYRLNTILLNL